MKVLCTPVKTSEQAIREQVRGEGKLNFNQLLVRGKQVSRVELRYVEYFVMKYQMIHRKGFSLFRRNSTEVGRFTTQTVYILGNGSTGSTSYMEVLPEMVTEDVTARLQKADYPVDRMKLSARITLIKLFRRHMGGRMPDFQMLEATSLYRPFYLIYYDFPRGDGKQLCSVRAADGYSVGKR